MPFYFNAFWFDDFVSLDFSSSISYFGNGYYTNGGQMKIHEYQAEELLDNFSVPIVNGKVAFSVEEVKDIVKEINSWPLVLKAQIHAGGRGKGGGIKLVNNFEEAIQKAREMLGMTLVTPQTGPEGKIVRRILVAKAVNIKKEYYAGIVLDRERNQLVFMASTEGGVEIEKVAAETPEKIIKEYINNSIGLQTFQARRMALALGFSGSLLRTAVQFFHALYEAYVNNDCSLLEINPLVLTDTEELFALDVKMNIDDNALYRQSNIQKMRDIDEENPLEVEASKYNLNYIKLDGTVGCMVNGAGLAMATMDIIKYAGAEPANFLDVGGGASEETVENGLRILLSDKNVKAVLINIFGGIVRCDRVAKGVVNAAQKADVRVPVVVRLAGTNADIAADIMEKSSLNIIVAHNLADAATKVVNALG